MAVWCGMVWRGCQKRGSGRLPGKTLPTNQKEGTCLAFQSDDKHLDEGARVGEVELLF